MGALDHPTAVLAELFDGGAQVYDRCWAPVLHRRTRELARLVPDAETPRVVLDVATGAGTLLPELQRLGGPAGVVLGLDRSLGMLRQAPGHASLVQADAMRLPVADARADVVVQAFVLFLLPDAPAAVAEAARVLRPGGWLLAATWSEQRTSPAEQLVLDEIDRAGAPPAPALPRSDRWTSSPDRLRDLLVPAGFTDIETIGRPLGARFDAESVLALRTGAAASGWRFRQLSAGHQADVLRRCRRGLASLAPEDFADDSEVLLTRARRR